MEQRNKVYKENMMITINSKEQLKTLAKQLKVRSDWHEPDEQNVSAEVRGQTFDNAGFYGLEYESETLQHINDGSFYANLEMYVILYQNDKAVAQINLATLFAIATDYTS